MSTALIDKEFTDAVAESFAAYQESGARSNKKLIPIHKWFAETIQKKLDNEYSVTALGIGNGKESRMDGKYYPKALDIAIQKGKEIIVTVSLKFVTSNYKQNSNNYFENLLGETANIRRAGVGFAHFLILRSETPYYSKNSGNLRGEEMKKEIITLKDLLKYIKLFKDTDFPHQPDVLGIALVDIDEASKNVKLSNLNGIVNTEESIFSVEIFIEKVIALVVLKS